MNRLYQTVFAFPGVGIKYCGKEIEFFKKNQEYFMHFIKEASSFSKCNFLEKLKNGDLTFDNTIDENIFSIIYSCGVANYFKAKSILPDLLICYSFGVYGALIISEVLTFKEAVAVMIDAHIEMDNVAKKLEPSDVAVIVGLIKEDAEELLCRLKLKTVVKINENNDTCIVVSGLKKELDIFCKKALDENAFGAELLNVNLPFHNSRLLENIKDSFGKKLQNYSFKTPKIPIISSIDQSLITTKEMAKLFVNKNISTPLNWYKTVESATKDYGAKKIFEVGVGISLTQNGRFTSFDLEYINIKNYQRKLV